VKSSSQAAKSEDSDYVTILSDPTTYEKKGGEKGSTDGTERDHERSPRRNPPTRPPSADSRRSQGSAKMSHDLGKGSRAPSPVPRLNLGTAGSVDAQCVEYATCPKCNNLGFAEVALPDGS